MTIYRIHVTACCATVGGWSIGEGKRLVTGRSKGYNVLSSAGEVTMPWLVYREAPNGQRNLLRGGDNLTEAQADSRIESVAKRAPKGNSFSKLEYRTNQELMFLMEEHDITVLDK